MISVKSAFVLNFYSLMFWHERAPDVLAEMVWQMKEEYRIIFILGIKIYARRKYAPLHHGEII